MLVNSSNHIVDAKGRIFFPQRFHEDMWDKVVICRGQGQFKFLMVFSKEGWEAFTGRFDKLKYSEREKLRRYFFQLAAETGVDAQGRLQLPQNLREFAGLDKNVVVTGMQDHAEIWDADEWNRMQGTVADDDIADLMDLL